MTQADCECGSVDCGDDGSMSDWVVGIMFSLGASIISISGLTVIKFSHMVKPKVPKKKKRKKTSVGPEEEEESNLSEEDEPKDKCCSAFWQWQRRNVSLFFYILGFTLFMASQPINMTALTFAPLVILGPLTAWDVVCGMIFSSCALREPFSVKDVMATVSVAGFCAAVVALGPHIDAPCDFTGEHIIYFWETTEGFIWTVFGWSSAFFCSYFTIRWNMARKRKEKAKAEAEKLAAERASGLNADGGSVDDEEKIIMDVEQIKAAEANRLENVDRESSDDSGQASGSSVSSVVGFAATGRWQKLCNTFARALFPINAGLFSAWCQLYAKVLGMIIRNASRGDSVDGVIIALASCSIKI